MRTPEELKVEQEKKSIKGDAVISFPDSLDPIYLLHHPLEAIVLDEETGLIERRPVGRGWRPML
jgi:hypothetical protein